MLTLFGCINITWSFNLIVSFTFQPIPSLEINDLRVSLDKFLILDRYALLEADLRCFCYSLSLYINHKIQHLPDMCACKIFRENQNKRKPSLQAIDFS